ncbi:MAG: hypothetical protein VSS75_012505 [Candidatus Parabeggiatoa sp.]|nr:hypothetical protein [Candidatus Parabeggiatoa sp.]
MWSSLFEKKAGDIELDIELISGPNTNAIGWSINELACGKVSKSEKLKHRWLRELSGTPEQKVSAKKAIDAYIVLRNSFNNHELYKPSLSKLMSGYKYRQKMYLFCDSPSTELSLYPIIAQYAFPRHYNVQETRRFSYIAEGKKTRMYTDVIPFDSCRYIYDWLSSTELITNSFELEAQQLIYRFALDGLANHIYRYNDDYLFGVHVIGHEKEFPAKKLSQRIEVR